MLLADDTRYLKGGPVAARIIAGVRATAEEATKDPLPSF